MGPLVVVVVGPVFCIGPHRRVEGSSSAPRRALARRAAGRSPARAGEPATLRGGRGPVPRPWPSRAGESRSPRHVAAPWRVDQPLHRESLQLVPPQRRDLRLIHAQNPPPRPASACEPPESRSAGCQTFLAGRHCLCIVSVCTIIGHSAGAVTAPCCLRSESRTAPSGFWTPPPSQAPGPFPKTSSLGNAAMPRLGSSTPTPYRNLRATGSSCRTTSRIEGLRKWI